MAVDPVTAVLNVADTLIDRLVPNKERAREAKDELRRTAESNRQELNLAQIAVNKVEAASKHLWVAGWRPAVGWICVVSLGNNYLLVPYVNAFSSSTVPALPVEQLIGLLTTLLGMAGYRTYEKHKGVAREQG